MPTIDEGLNAISAGRRDDPLAPVTVIVPTHVDGLQLRRRLAAIGPFAGVWFEKRSLREVPFAVMHEGVVLEGFIDLVIETDGGLEIVDWKTDAINEKDIDERLRAYELQAGLYGIERSPGSPPERREAALARLEQQASAPA